MTRRIAMISEHASPLGMLGGIDSGGQNVYVGQLARHLAEAGYEVDVFTRRDHADAPEVVDWTAGVRIVHVPAGPPEFVRKEELLPYMDEFTAWVLRFFRRQRKRYELVHANFWMSGLVATEIKREMGVPFVVTFHALGRVRRHFQRDADQFPEERFAIEDRVVAEADHVLAECPQDEEDLIRLYNADPSKITIVPCGFDQAEFFPVSKALARVVLGLSPDERIILQLGRLVPRKGVDNVIRGFARLTQRHNVAARLLIVGGECDDPESDATPELARLRGVARDAQVADLVQFIGRRGREALKYYYSAADIFVTTPWYEPFGITPVEAMACGTPIVGANVGGIKFTVRDGETGYLVPPNDPEALAERLAHLYEHPKLLSVFRYQAVRRVNDLFTWRKVADSVALLYEDVLAASRPGFSVESQHLALIDHGFAGAMEAMRQAQHRVRGQIRDASEMLDVCFSRGGKVLICGNGGSAADAQHFAGELVGRFKCSERPGLPALALSADTAVLTAWSNDVGYDDVFARQVQAFGRAGDILIGISTSGRARNVAHAFEMARRRGLQTIAVLGGDGGTVRSMADLAIVVPARDTQRIQEVQILVVHLLCELVEERMFGARPALAVHRREDGHVPSNLRRLRRKQGNWKIRGRAGLNRNEAEA
ncbi:MAG TPA: glycosyltransferase [Dehalococcoidia bacterium]|nr:glycosyltransferase [Dehalococcoidia bacterium]